MKLSNADTETLLIIIVTVAVASGCFAALIFG